MKKTRKNWGLLFILAAVIILSMSILSLQFQEETPPLKIAGKSFFTGVYSTAKDVVFFGMMKTLLVFFGIVIFFTRNKRK